MTLILNSRPNEAPEIVDDATRREFLTLMAAAGLLSACGRGSEQATSTTTQPARRVRDFFGNDVAVPATTDRIVAADDIALGNL